MANKKQLAILRQGVDAWNKWREKHSEVQVDFTLVNARGTDLRGANLSGALIHGNFHGANFSGANLSGADFGLSFLNNADLSNADLRGADLGASNLSGANLSGANLSNADLLATNFSGANLVRVDLQGANLFEAKLSGADLTDAILSGTMFADDDLSVVKGLESVKHEGPSEISISTIYKSKGNIPEVFLRGCGVPDDMIAFVRSLKGNPIEFYSCFISYSSKDQEFSERIYADLQNKGVRCWFAPEDLKIGDKFRTRIDEAIRVYDKLLLVLSEHSIQSDWVEKEAETAFEKERQQKRMMLFPVRIDDTVMDCPQAWAADIRRTRHIGDMTKWKEHDQYQKAFERLLRDLKTEHAEG